LSGISQFTLQDTPICSAAQNSNTRKNSLACARESSESRWRQSGGVTRNELAVVVVRYLMACSAHWQQSPSRGIVGIEEVVLLAKLTTLKTFQEK